MHPRGGISDHGNADDITCAGQCEAAADDSHGAGFGALQCQRSQNYVTQQAGQFGGKPGRLQWILMTHYCHSYAGAE